MSLSCIPYGNSRRLRASISNVDIRTVKTSSLFHISALSKSKVSSILRILYIVNAICVLIVVINLSEDVVGYNFNNDNALRLLKWLRYCDVFVVLLFCLLSKTASWYITSRHLCLQLAVYEWRRFHCRFSILDCGGWFRTIIGSCNFEIPQTH